MDFYQYESRLNRPLMKKLAELQSNQRLKHLIFTAQLDLELLEFLFPPGGDLERSNKCQHGTMAGYRPSSVLSCSCKRNFWILVEDVGHCETKRT